MLSTPVDQHVGRQLENMYHCTDITAAKAIVQSQLFRGGDYIPPAGRRGADLVGPGVYLSRDRHKAETYRRPKQTGPVLTCRVKLGECIELRDQPNGSADPLMKTWHVHNAPCRGCDLPDGKCEIRGRRYNSAWKPEGVKGTVSVNGVYLEENCVYNADRIDHIEIIDGEGKGMGRDSPNWKHDERTVEDMVRVQGYAWCWFDDSPGGGYQDKPVPYGEQTNVKIMSAWEDGQTILQLDNTYTVDFTSMKQRRNDDMSRKRKIELILSADMLDLDCHGNHGLLFFQTQRHDFRCDTCGKSVTRGATMYGCRLGWNVQNIKCSCSKHDIVCISARAPN